MKSQTPSGLTILSEVEFLTLAAKKETPDDIAIFRACPAATKQIGDSRSVKFTISSENPDRERDIIKMGGWDLQNYQKNPVVLWAHNYKEPPVARAQGTGIEGKVLNSVAEFVPKDVYPFAETIFQMVRMKILNASSVGFRPLKYMLNEERMGIDIEQQELLEWSIVPVPCNADALAQLSALPQPVLEPYLKACESMLELAGASGLWFPGKGFGETVVRALKPTQVAVGSQGEQSGQKSTDLKVFQDCSAGTLCQMPEVNNGDVQTCPNITCPLKAKVDEPIVQPGHNVPANPSALPPKVPDPSEEDAHEPEIAKLVAAEVARQLAVKAEEECVIEIEPTEWELEIVEDEKAVRVFEVDPAMIRASVRQSLRDGVSPLAADAIASELQYAQGRVS